MLQVLYCMVMNSTYLIMNFFTVSLLYLNHYSIQISATACLQCMHWHTDGVRKSNFRYYLQKVGSHKSLWSEHLFLFIIYI